MDNSTYAHIIWVHGDRHVSVTIDYGPEYWSTAGGSIVVPDGDKGVRVYPQPPEVDDESHPNI